MGINTCGKKIIYAIAFVGCHTLVHTIDNPHFFKAASFHGYFPESRWGGRIPDVPKDWQTKLSLRYGHGSARKGWDVDGNKTDLLNIHGYTNSLYLTTNIPALPCSTNFVHFIARDINQSKGCGSFGQLAFKGKFSLDEVNIDLRQQLVADFFIAAHLPVRHLSINDVCLDDCSPTCGRYSQCNPYWRRFLTNFNPLLAHHDLKPYTCKFSKTAVGDLTVLAGWNGIDHEAFDLLDYMAATVQLGLLFPTGEKEDTRIPFAIPTGYNDHWGIALHTDATLGIARWLALSARAGAIFFFDKTRPMRLKTDQKQCGWIKLAHGSVKEDKGTNWYVGCDLLLDHFIKGFSFLVGYSFNRGEADELKPREKCCVIQCNPCCDPSLCSCCPCETPTSTSSASCQGCIPTAVSTNAFDQNVINSDCRLQPWQMHVIHFVLDYDFSIHMKNQEWAPHLSFFYDLPVSGKHAFDTDMVGGGMRIDVRW